MNLKKYIILIILTIFLFSIASVSASGTNETLMTSIDDSPTELSKTDEKVINQKNMNDKTGAGEGTYEELSNEIGTGGDKNLTKSYYKYTGGNTIEISTPGVINGNGAVIDMNGSNIRAFYVTASGVTIKNLTISNTNINGNGAAIYFKQQGSIANCNFINNQATVSNGGGAIYFEGQGSVTNCNFNNNRATGAFGGGAIYFNGQGDVTNCNFNNNQANSSYGGAVYFFNDGEVTNCNFTNNQLNGDYGGGAVYFRETGSVINCSFSANSATRNGGAIYFKGHGSVINCNFNNNRATGSYGGAVYFIGQGGDVTNCNFNNNTANKGGAIYSLNSATTADTCIFKTSSDTKINVVTRSPTLNVDNFTSFYGSGEKLTFNLTTNSGMPISNGNILISVYFKNNNSEVCNYTCLSGEGWIVDLPVGEYYATFDTEYAGFQKINRTITVMPNNTFAFLNYTINGNNNSVIELSNDFYYDAAYDVAFVKGIVINRPVTINGNGNTIDAKGKTRIFNVAADYVIIKNITFTNGNINNILDRGAAIQLFGNYAQVVNCSFTNNVAWCYGAVYLNGNNNSIINSNFVNNSALVYGGAIGVLNSNGFSMFSCSFVNNSATKTYAGAIILDLVTDVNISDCIFINNTAETNCGALYILGGGNAHISGCTFINNGAVNEGGAIAVLGNDFYIYNCVFLNNSADAGVIFINTQYDQSKNFTINNNIFLNNNAVGIYFWQPESTGDVDYNWFGNNATNYNTAPITTNTNMTNWLFLNTTYCPDILLVSDSFSTAFKLYAFNNITKNVSYYNNSLVMPVNLTITQTNGQANDKVNIGETINYIANSIGTGSLTATIENAAYTIEFDIIKYDPGLSVESQEISYGNNIIIVLDYNSTATGKVNITLKGKNNNNYSFTGMDLNNTILLLQTINVDEYEVNVSYSGNEIFGAVTATANITVNKAKTVLSANAVVTVYNVNKYLVITLKDVYGNPLKGVGISVDLNGAKTYTTDANGQVKVSTKGLAPKTYTAKVTFNGDTNYEKSAKNVKVSVKKAASKIAAAKKTFKAKTKVKKYAAVLKDSTGKAIKNAKLTLKVKGKTYAAKTNSKGKAVFKITKLNKKGIYKAVIKFNGDKYYVKSGKNTKITVKASKSKTTFKTVSQGSKDAKTVKKIQQALKDHGYYLSYKGHYLKVDGKYNSCTVRSVKEFQRDHGLKQTGKVDAKTAKKLGII